MVTKSKQKWPDKWAEKKKQKCDSTLARSKTACDQQEFNAPKKLCKIKNEKCLLDLAKKKSWGMLAKESSADPWVAEQECLELRCEWEAK